MSYGLVAAVSLLVLPWTVLLLQRPVMSRPTHERPIEPRVARRRLVRSLLRRLTLLATVMALLVARWMVVASSHGTHPAYLGAARSYTLALGLCFALGVASQGLRWSTFFARVSAQPARLMAASFGAAGVVGALLLSLPVSHQNVATVSLVDSLFMAVSAVCVTGLSVNNLAETYSLFGQAVLCLLVQIGGLGIMVLSAAIAILVGQRMRVRSSAMLTEIVDGSSLASLRRTVVMICAYTLALEAVGAILLYLQLRALPAATSVPGHPVAGGALWAAVFHAVSAFCNAGFSTLSEGLVPLGGRPGMLGVITTLIVLGGIGFPVLDELTRALRTRVRGQRVPALSLHTRVALRLTALFLGALAACYLLLEWRHGFRSLPYPARVYAAVFQSASARTAGFNVVDLSTLRPATLVLTCVAMIVGASPGSTGGGIKVTTVAALYAGLRSELSGAPASLLDRALPEGVIRKAIGVVFLSLLLVSGAFFLLLLVEPHPALDLLFEAVSAFSTTGLSTGITPRLTVPGKLLVIALMLTGRIGPLTLALAVSNVPQRRPLRLPEERILIG